MFNSPFQFIFCAHESSLWIRIRILDTRGTDPDPENYTDPDPQHCQQSSYLQAEAGEVIVTKFLRYVTSYFFKATNNSFIAFKIAVNSNCNGPLHLKLGKEFQVTR